LDIANVQLQSAGLYEALKKTRASVDPIQVFAEQEAEETIDNLCGQRADAMRDTLRGPTNTDSDFEKSLIEHALGEDGLPELELKAALEEGVLADLAAICETLEDTGLNEREFEYELTREEDDVRRVTKVAHGILGENRELEDRYGVTCQLLELGEETHDELADTTCKTARALAAATMYAGAFSQIDETRLLYIASHIVKVLDNHMLHQALQRGLELDYDALDALGLEHFGLELLEILHSYTQRTASALRHLHQRETYHLGKEAPRLSTHLPRLKELVEAIAKCSNGDSDSDEDEWLDYHLATIISPSRETSECILEEIYERGTRLGLQVESHRNSEECLSRITFRPADSRGPSGEQRLAKSVLYLKEEDGDRTDRTRKLTLLICFERAALCDRNLRALWGAVNVLEDTLKVIEATTGRTICYS
jgi:hypothetical protein